MRRSVKKYHLYKKLSSLLVVNFYILLGGLGGGVETKGVLQAQSVIETDA